ncbi:hypothetical protein G4B88_023444 [Cannabis sativa]|uniref:Transcription factor IIIC 90kDa subunit N-terminal domain-containing protein n=1 Tax=Cannabis sativa TaxID=3483 RepID=A0A7J6HWS9_CANSA|nr:hypothetical protein G4B88_018362 [Cannabis sativa]KAF4398850.1 hypothetical protein G4B88_023444 [Cannabis sativa]
MASRFQAAALSASPFYPNALAWSDDNLIAVASAHLVTILVLLLLLPLSLSLTIYMYECMYGYAYILCSFIVRVLQCLLNLEVLSRSKPASLIQSVLLIVLICYQILCFRLVYLVTFGLVFDQFHGRRLDYLQIQDACLLCAPLKDVLSYIVNLFVISVLNGLRYDVIKVMDISAKLYDYLESTSYGELKASIPNESDKLDTEVDSDEDCLNVILRKQRKRRRSIKNALETDTGQLKESNCMQIVSVSKSKANSLKKIPEKSTLPLITADKYATRSAILSSLVVAWSPVLQVSPKMCAIPQNGSSMSLLAVGGKSGKVSLWRVSVPECYSIDLSRVPTTATIVGLLQAHGSWVTAISWALLDSESSNPLFLLVTGSSDGSVKIWMIYNEQLLKSSEANHASLSLLKEVINDDVPVSVISLTVPAQSSNKIFLAVGKGSGIFEVWICDISNSKYDKVGSYDSHDNIVTGLAWAFEGRCLYSCSQDNYVRCWIWSNDVLSEVPLPSNTPRLRSPSELSHTYASCFGVAVSPGNLVIAMIRNFDEDLLDPMYQKRTQKAAVEFFWIGAQEVSVLSNNSSTFALPGIPVKELSSWEVNILWSLKQYECPSKPIIVWDIVAGLLAFKRFAAKYVEHILIKWLSISYIGSNKYHSTEKILLHIPRIFSKLSSRQLHLLNIICRRVMLSELKADQINSKLENLKELDCSDEKLIIWIKLLLSSERELRERLIGLNFSTCVSLLSNPSTSLSSPPGNRFPVGLAQMQQWVALNRDYVHDPLIVLASEVQKHEKRLQSSKNATEEECCYCSAPVPFKSPEFAHCESIGQGHKLARCSVSMEVCLTIPTWFCICCHRRTSTLPPETLFTLPGYPSFDLKSSTALNNASPKPLCPFCGIVLQRQLPDFLLSASPV